MKFNKTISKLLATTLALSVFASFTITANAELEYTVDGTTVTVTAIPSEAELAQRSTTYETTISVVNADDEGAPTFEDIYDEESELISDYAYTDDYRVYKISTTWNVGAVAKQKAANFLGVKTAEVFFDFDGDIAQSFVDNAVIDENGVMFVYHNPVSVGGLDNYSAGFDFNENKFYQSAGSSTGLYAKTYPAAKVATDNGQITLESYYVVKAAAPEITMTESTKAGKTAQIQYIGKCGEENVIEGYSVIPTLANTSDLTFEVPSSTVAVTGVTVTPETATLTVDETVALTATVEPAEATNKAVTWTSNADSIASVSAEGVVTAKAPGEATITATTADGSFTDTCVVTVNAKTVPAIGVTITNAPAEMEIGDELTLVATVDPDNTTDTLVWSSSAPTIVSVNAETGAIEALAAGEATITATCGAATDTVTITVNEPAPAGFEFVVGTCKAIDAGTKKGYVWSGNIMKNINTIEKTYTAVFSTGTETKEAALDLTAAVEVVDATLVFDAVLTTDRTITSFIVKEN